MASKHEREQEPASEIAVDDAVHERKRAKQTKLEDELKACRNELTRFIAEKKCAPIMVRLAWHDSGTYDKDVSEWPKCGGANGSIRFEPEIKHGANAGLVKAVGLLEPIKKKYPQVSYADLYQMASAAGIEVCDGPKIPLVYGRIDVADADGCPPEHRLPAAKAPFPDDTKTPAEHLRKVFYRMNLTDKDIVALSGAHTIGRAFKGRSGLGSESTAYTENVDEGVTPGGTSWTKQWLQFDNSYFVEAKEKTDKDLLVLDTDACLFEDKEFRNFAVRYAEDQGAFFKDYAESHKKLSELGVKWIEGGPISINE